MKGNYEK